MNYEYALSRAKELVNIARDRRISPVPVDDETWGDLIEIGNWAKEHAGKPGLLTHAIPQRDSTPA
jgi:hypothetical protein